MIYLLITLLLFVGCLRGQCLERKFVKHYVDTILSSVIGEIFSMCQLECSAICGENINCMGFMRLSNGNCVMFGNVIRDTPGLTPVFIEGKRMYIHVHHICYCYIFSFIVSYMAQLWNMSQLSYFENATKILILKVGVLSMFRTCHEG